MNRSLLALALAIVTLLSNGGAFAMSSQSGNSIPSAFINLADPDDQAPSILKPHSSAATDNFDDAPDGQGFINRDVVEQSKARGNGSFLPSDDPQK
jgi:hypothetical protein